MIHQPLEAQYETSDRDENTRRNRNKPKRSGTRKSKGDYIWHCAPYILTAPTKQPSYVPYLLYLCLLLAQPDDAHQNKNSQSQSHSHTHTFTIDRYPNPFIHCTALHCNRRNFHPVNNPFTPSPLPPPIIEHAKQSLNRPGKIRRTESPVSFTFILLSSRLYC